MIKQSAVYYILIINLCGFAVMGIDKWLARHQRRRVPERVLFTLAAAGGSVGVWVAMQCFRHKTLHRSFSIGIPLIFAVQLVVIWFISRLIGY